MAAFFLVLAVVVGVVIGDAVVGNTDAASIQIFDQTISGFTQGQFLVIAAGVGFVFAALLYLLWGSSKIRRVKRRERREARRDMEGRIGDLERENATLREGTDRDRRTSRLDDLGGGDETRETTQAARRLHPRGPGGPSAPAGSNGPDSSHDQTGREHADRH